MSRDDLQPGAAGTAPGDRSTLPATDSGARRFNLTRLIGLGFGALVIVAAILFALPRGSQTQPEQKDRAPRLGQTVALQNRVPPEPVPPRATEVLATPPAAAVVQPSAVIQPDPNQKMLDASRRAPVLAFKTNSPDMNLNQPLRPASAADVPSSGLLSPPGQTDRDAGLGRMLETTSISRARARSLGDLNLLLTAGTIVPCNLDTAIDTTSPGFVSCHTERDILSANGLVVLLDRGTKVLGEYQQGLRQGQERIFVVWNRAVTPDGVAIDLGSPAADSLGRSGFDGTVETYFWTRFGSTLMLSIISDATSYARNQITDGSGDNTGTQTVGGVNTAAAEALRNSINIPPVLRKNQGETVSIFLARDLDFTGVYALRTTRR